LDRNHRKIHLKNIKTDHVEFGEEGRGIEAQLVVGNESAEDAAGPMDPMEIGPMDHLEPQKSALTEDKADADCSLLVGQPLPLE
jgi:hypothetical protein